MAFDAASTESDDYTQENPSEMFPSISSSVSTPARLDSMAQPHSKSPSVSPFLFGNERVGVSPMESTKSPHSSRDALDHVHVSDSLGTPISEEEAEVPGNFREDHEVNDVQQLAYLVNKINAIPSWLGLADLAGNERKALSDANKSPQELRHTDYFNFKAPSSALRYTQTPDEPVQHEEPDVIFHAAPDDDTWSLVSADPMDVATNGMESQHAGSSSVPLQELEKIELDLFLKHFGRHTREVRMFANNPRSSRMPQWSDFAYSSSEEEQEEEEEVGHYIARVDKKPKRSRLLTHIDRGLQYMHEDVQPFDSVKRSKSDDRLPRSKSAERLPGRTTYSPGPLKRSDSTRTSTAVFEPPLRSPNESLHSPEVAEIHPDNEKRVHFPHHEEHVDGVAFMIAYILALVEHFAPADLDEAPITEYRESRARSHIERLYIIAPFWEQLEKYVRALYRWENPSTTAAAAMIYFVLWYTDLLPAAFLLTLVYYVAQFRFMPPKESYLHRKVQERMERGRDADKLAERLKRRSRLDMLDLYKRWQNKYGVPSQIFVSDVADFHEKVKNLLLWRNPDASRRTLVKLLVFFFVACTVTATVWWKMTLFMIGFDFFALMPLRSHYPRYRRPLNPLWWFVLGSPTDAQYAVHLLRERHSQYHKWFSQVQDARAEESLDQERNAVTEISRGLDFPSDSSDAPKVESRRQRRGKKLGSFFCQHHGMPGHLQITTKMLYFSPLYAGPIRTRSSMTELDEIDGLLKTHHNKLWIWTFNGLRISRYNRSALNFTNMTRRDDAFNLLLTLRSDSAYCFLLTRLEKGVVDCVNTVL